MGDPNMLARRRELEPEGVAAAGGVESQDLALVLGRFSFPLADTYILVERLTFEHWGHHDPKRILPGFADQTCPKAHFQSSLVFALT